MRTTDSKGFLFLAFLLTLSAGLAGGMLAARAWMPAPRPATARSPLDELQLSADQTQQMRKIWESVRDSAQTCLTRGQSLRRQRDKAMEAILTDEQKARFEKVDQEYNSRIAALNNERENAFQKAVERTEQILTPPQRAAYEKILRAQTGREPGQRLLDSPDATGQSAPVSKASVIQ